MFWLMRLAALALSLATAAAAVPPVEAYGGLPSVDLIAVSPDGSKIAMAVSRQQVRQVQVRSFDGGKLLTTVPVGEVKVRGLQWAGDHHLLITRSTTTEVAGLTGPKREWFLAVDLNLQTHKVMSLLGGIGEGSQLNTIDGLPEVRMIGGRPIAFVVGTTFPGLEGIATLFKVDLDSRSTTTVVAGNPDTSEWLLDDTGAIVARVDYQSRAGRWSLFTKSGNHLTRSLDNRDPLDTPSLLGLGRSRDVVLVKTFADDEWTAHELPLGGTQLSPAIEEMTGAALIPDPHTGTVIGTAVEDGMSVTYRFSSDADQHLWKMIAKAFPGSVVRLESWSDDRHKIILRVEGKTQGAAYFALDTVAKHADWLANEYADIAPDDVGTQSVIHYAAADGTDVPAFLTLPPGVIAAKNLPLIVLPHGGPGAHDDSGFDWWAQALASRGYVVLQPQFRGSTGQGERFHRAGYGEWGRKMQTDLSDGVAFLAGKGMIDPRRVGIVGASYGGYAALAGVTLQHGIYACAVSLAGPSDLRAMLSYEETMTGGDKNSTLRFWQRFMGAKSPTDPALDAISPIRFADKVDVPVLLIHGQDDTVVAYSQSKAMAAALARAGHPAKLVTLPGEDHWLSRGMTRTAMLRATVDFLAANLAANPPAVAAR